MVAETFDCHPNAKSVPNICATMTNLGGSVFIVSSLLQIRMREMPHFGNPDYAAIEVRPIWE